MYVYLVQHGKALSKEEDPQRPLSDAGRAEVECVAEYLAERCEQVVVPRISEVMHSGRLRAQQTAELVANCLAPSSPFRAVDGLSPNDDPARLADRLQARRDEDTAVMIVGHLPHLARLVGLLVAGNAEVHPVRFRNAGVVRLHWDGHWAVDWALWPELAD